MAACIDLIDRWMQGVYNEQVMFQPSNLTATVLISIAHVYFPFHTATVNAELKSIKLNRPGVETESTVKLKNHTPSVFLL